MTSSPKPTILIVPGAWHGSVHMGPLIEYLSSHSYPSIALDLPTGSAPDKDLYDDIRYITSYLEEIVSHEGKEVIIVLHSYGGLPGSSAARSFVKQEQAEKGKEGGVIGVVYISAWALPAGKTITDTMEGLDFGWAKIDGPTATPTNPIHHLYNDLPTSTAEYYVSQLKPYCVIANTQPGTADCLGGVVPTAYILCEKDNTIPSWLQEKHAQNLGESARVVRFDSGHSPYLSRVEEVGNVVRVMAGEEVGGGVAG